MADENLEKTYVFPGTDPVESERTETQVNRSSVLPEMNDKTIAYAGKSGLSDNLEGTLRPTETMKEEDDLSSAEMFRLKGEDYEKVSCLSDNSGEAQVFLVKKDGKEYVLKLYYPNFDINRKLLQVVRSFEFEMIVDLIDFGKTYVDGKNRHYELMEYLRGGTLKDVKLNGDFDRFRRIALQAAAALAYCHKNNLLHKDVKPTNYFFRDEAQQELVLGDFGISSIQDTEGKSFRTTQARTPIYAAPEMYTDVIDGEVEITFAADYYSLGMTLFTLWLGENPMGSNERMIMKQKNEGRLPRLNELPDPVRRLVQGLTVVNQQTRWGYDEVERWFRGETVEVDLSSPFLRYKSFIVDPEHNLVAENVHELVPMLMSHQKLAINYLYGGRIVKWLEASGNIKLSAMVKEIVSERYPSDQRAGLMAACYGMEPTLGYTDVAGIECEDMSAIAYSLLTNQEKYSILLQNPNDPLFIWLEMREKGNVARLRSYFTQGDDSQGAVLRMVYELDSTIPFLPKMPSSTVEEIAHAFGYEDMSDDNWRSLCDGRFLSWLYSHADLTECEAVKQLTQGKRYSRSMAYKVFYRLLPSVAYDLREADTPEKIGELLAHEMVKSQHLSEEELATNLQDYISTDGRFYYYAKLHGWKQLTAEASRCFDLKSEENRERLSAYDLHTALYRFCRILGVVPSYFLPSGKTLTNADNLDVQRYPHIRTEMRNGSLVQWSSVFFHENPQQEFLEDYSYERELERWVKELGRLDPQQVYYRRYKKAIEETSERVKEVKEQWLSARIKEQGFKYGFFGLCVVWAILIFIIGLEDRSYIFQHHFATIVFPLGGMTGIIVGTRAFLKGYGAMMSFLFGGIGLLTSFIPYYLLRYVDVNFSSLFQVAVLLLTIIYALVAWLTDFSRDQGTDAKFINETLKKEDIKSTLLEPLYYTFKTKSQRYKASHFGVLDEIDDQLHSASGESVIHYFLWSLLALVMILELCLFSPKVIGWKQPSKATQQESVK